MAQGHPKQRIIHIQLFLHFLFPVLDAFQSPGLCWLLMNPHVTSAAQSADGSLVRACAKHEPGCPLLTFAASQMEATMPLKVGFK